MIRRLLLYAAVLSVASWFAVLAPSLSRAADPAQRVVRVGFVSPFSPSTDLRSADGFWHRLRELGWVEGQNLIVESRWAVATLAAKYRSPPCIRFANSWNREG